MSGKSKGKATIKIVVAVSDGQVTAVMSDEPGIKVELFNFDKQVEQLANSEFSDEPSTAKAADQVDRNFAKMTAGMTDLLSVAGNNRKGQVHK